MRARSPVLIASCLWLAFAACSDGQGGAAPGGDGAVEDLGATATDASEVSDTADLAIEDSDQTTHDPDQDAVEVDEEDVYRPDVIIDEPETFIPPDTHLEIISITPAHGPTTGGTELVILGRRLTVDTDVYLGGELCGDIDYVDDTKIVCVSPPGSAGNVALKLENGESLAVLPGAFLYTAPLEIIAVDPPIGPTTGGMPAELRGTGFVEGTQVSIGARLAPRTEVLSESLLRFVTPPGTVGFQTVRVSNERGVVETLEGFRYFAPLRVEAVAPAVGVSAGGEEVMVQGRGFSEGRITVRFGLLEAEAAVVSDERIRAVTPPGAADLTVDVAVTSDIGGEVVRPDGFTYFDALDGNRLVHVSPDVGATSGGYPAILSGPGLGTVVDGAVRFGGLVGDIVERGAHFAIVTVPPHVAGSVDVTAVVEGELLTLEAGFTYVPGVELRDIAPDEGNVAGGLPFRVTGGGFDDTTQVLIGGLQGSDLVITPTSITGVTPPGVLGLADVEVIAGTGSRAVLEDAYLYTTPLHLAAIAPLTGSIAGGTRLVLSGTGFIDPMEVSFGTVPASSFEILDAATIIAVSPPHPEGYVAVEVSRRSATSSAPDRFLYFDPTGIDWGSSGGEIGGAVNVTVLSSGGQPIPDALVQLNIRGESVVAGSTDNNGHVTLSGPDVLGQQTVSATALGFSSATVQAVNAENITVVLECVPENPCMASSDCRDGFACTCGPPFNAPGICLRDGFCGLEVQTQEQFDAMCTGSFDQAEAGTITGQLTGLHKLIDPQPGERLMGMVVTTQPHPFIRSPVDAGPGNVLEDDGPYTLRSALGELALVAVCGVQNDTTQTFTPLYLGVRRGLFIVAGETYEIDIDCDIELTESLTIKAVNPPLRLPDGPNNIRHRPWLHFGSEGFYGLPEIDAGTEAIVTECCAPPLEGQLAGVELMIVGGTYTNRGAPRSMVLHDGIGGTDDVIVLPEFTPVVDLTTPEGLEPLVERYLEWELTSDGEPDYYDLAILDFRDPRIVYWDVLVPGDHTTVNLPFWPDADRAGLFPEALMILSILAVNAVSFDYDDFDGNDFSFTNRRSYSVQSFFLDNRPATTP